MAILVAYINARLLRSQLFDVTSRHLPLVRSCALRRGCPDIHSIPRNTGSGGCSPSFCQVFPTWVLALALPSPRGRPSVAASTHFSFPPFCPLLVSSLVYAVLFSLKFRLSAVQTHRLRHRQSLPTAQYILALVTKQILTIYT